MWNLLNDYYRLTWVISTLSRPSFVFFHSFTNIPLRYMRSLNSHGTESVYSCPISYVRSRWLSMATIKGRDHSWFMVTEVRRTSLGTTTVPTALSPENLSFLCEAAKMMWTGNLFGRSSQSKMDFSDWWIS